MRLEILCHVLLDIKTLINLKEEARILSFIAHIPHLNQ